MTLFEPSSNSQRIYTCFVCGHTFKEPEQYKLHILEKHDAGKDYVLCPLKRCGYPVRDLKSHYLTKHPTETIPKGQQMKAFVWRDQKDPKGGKKKRAVAFHSGDFVSHKNGKKLHYRSGYELEVYKCLESMQNVVRFDVEPFSVPYWHQGEQKNYFPDLIVCFADGSTEVWEIKPQSQTHYELNDSKWTAADVYCQKRGWKFEVKTEKGIKLLQEALR